MLPDDAGSQVIMLDLHVDIMSAYNVTWVTMNTLVDIAN